MAATKAPTVRKFTVSERRGLRFEQVSLYMVFTVALIAAAISFIALKSVGADAGLGRASFLLPIAIDGFGIACSVGIVRSVAAGEGFRSRASEWLGLVLALALSILGNCTHALAVGANTLPDYVKVAYAVAVPVIVAYGIHVYGRAMSKGISAHVLADSPDELVFDLRHLGDKVASAQRPAQPARTRVPATPVSAQPLPRTAQPARAPEALADGSEKGRARAVFDHLYAANPDEKPDAARVHKEAGVTRDIATSRRWVQKWWNDTQVESVADQVDQDAVSLSDARHTA